MLQHFKDRALVGEKKKSENEAMIDRVFKSGGEPKQGGDGAERTFRSRG